MIEKNKTHTHNISNIIRLSDLVLCFWGVLWGYPYDWWPFCSTWESPNLLNVLLDIQIGDRPVCYLNFTSYRQKVYLPSFIHNEFSNVMIMWLEGRIALWGISYQLQCPSRCISHLQHRTPKYIWICGCHSNSVNKYISYITILLYPLLQNVKHKEKSSIKSPFSSSAFIHFR